MALDPSPRRELHWSHREKGVARAAFDSALARENASIRREVENMLQRSSEPSAVWDILEFLATQAARDRTEVRLPLLGAYGRIRPSTCRRVDH